MSIKLYCKIVRSKIFINISKVLYTNLQIHTNVTIRVCEVHHIREV